MATDYRPGCDVVMVNYQTADDACRFIDSYDKYRKLDTSLWVVNVEPGVYDQVAIDARLQSIPPEVGYSSWEANIGYANACNDAAGFGDREVIGFFNADTRLTDRILIDIPNALMAHDDWAIAGPRQVDENNRLTHAGIFGTNEEPYLRGWQEQAGDEFSLIQDGAVSVSGSAYFIKRTVWDELRDCPIYQESCDKPEGAFLPTQHYYEETWCSYHARAHGYRVVYYGELTMIHKWHQASPVGGFAERQMPISQQQFRAACDAHGITHD